MRAKSDSTKGYENYRQTDFENKFPYKNLVGTMTTSSLLNPLGLFWQSEIMKAHFPTRFLNNITTRNVKSRRRETKNRDSH